MKSKNRDYIQEIDHLRAFAALLILVYHGFQLIGSHLTHGRAFGPDLPWPQPANPLMAVVVEGHSAVALFIVLSGFILSYGVFDKELNYGGFLLARCARIYPMMIVCLALAVATGSFDLLLIINSLLPIDSRALVPSPFTSMFWAVKIELQCYLLFPALLWLLKSKGAHFLVLVLVLALALRALAVFGAGADPRDISYWTVAGRLDQFVIGILAAKGAREYGLLRISPLCVLPAAVLVVSMLTLFNRLGGWPVQDTWRILFPPIEALVWAGLIVTYISAGRLLPAKIGTILVAVGTVSYSAYLLHPVVMEAVIQRQLWLPLAIRTDWNAIATSLLVVFPLVTGLATLAYHLIERPFMSMRPRYIR